VNSTLGDLLLEDVDNGALHTLAEKLCAAKLSPASIHQILLIPKLVLAGIRDPKTGQQLCKREWDSNFIDAPEIKSQRQPMFTSSECTGIVGKAEGKYRVLFAL